MPSDSHSEVMLLSSHRLQVLKYHLATPLDTHLKNSWEEKMMWLNTTATLPVRPAMKVSVRSLTDPVGLLPLGGAGPVLPGLRALWRRWGLARGTPASSYWAWLHVHLVLLLLLHLLILILEFTELSGKVPMSWEDFTTAFAMLATLMCLAASVIYPVFFTCSGPAPRPICATVASWLCFLAYGGEVVVTRLRPRGQISGFLSTVSGLLKILETFVACIIFTSLGLRHAVRLPRAPVVRVGLLPVLHLRAAHHPADHRRLLSYFPASFERPGDGDQACCRPPMYLTAMVIWPVYGFRGVRDPVPRGKVLV
ncbi:LOW QUALITY PROTEIN: hypothetical protein CRUP_036762, partial [Coryphaenoides rupestris]